MALTRRQLLAGGLGLAAAGAATGAVAAFGGNGREPGQQAASGGTPPTPSSTPSPRATPSPAPGAEPSGTAHLVARSGFSFDTFDAARSGQLAVLEVLGRTHSRLLQWTDFEAPALSGDLATAWEHPDETTIVLRLDPAARWHDRPPLDGALVTASDVEGWLRRALALAREEQLPAAQRQQDLAALESVDAPSEGLVRIHLARPDANVVLALAAPFALVQAPAAVEAFAADWHTLAPGSVVGSGSFSFDGFAAESGALAFSAHDGHTISNLAALIVAPADAPVDAFLSGTLHEYVARDRRQAPAIRAALSSAAEQPLLAGQGVISTLSIESSPWDNRDLRLALSGALNRGWLSHQLFGGRALPSGPVAAVHGGFALPAVQLSGYPGYRDDPDADAREARQRWEAAGGPALGTVTVDFPSVFDPAFSASEMVTRRLSEVLGTQFDAAVVAYTLISRRALAGEYGNGAAAFWFGWSPPYAGPDPGPWLGDTFAGVDPELDTLLSTLRLTVESEKRRAIVHEVGRLLAGLGGGPVIPWAMQQFELFLAPELHNRVGTPWPSQHLEARLTLA